MANEMHTTLPIEYQLKYGTARGNANLSDKVDNAPMGDCFRNTVLPYSNTVYTVPATCLNCGHRGRITVQKGVAVPDKALCPNCECSTFDPKRIFLRSTENDI